jgi:hypothetical protein
MRKSLLILFSILSLSLLGASLIPVKKVQLTIVNKSSMPMEFRLEGFNGDFEFFYYLRVPEGNRLIPAVESFTIYKGEYNLNPYYIEVWDPVYGYICDNTVSQTLCISHNTRLVFVECDPNVSILGKSSRTRFLGKWRYIY